ncbi:hypothetical protein [Desulfatiglans anilini]|uniref:hypothetical protein n=1 Tax=Desulfatiglans anilini TaxID=90728 RepID=UPI0004295F81|nr:hypothetical protein [Desulfatiglans anilini]
MKAVRGQLHEADAGMESWIPKLLQNEERRQLFIQHAPLAPVVVDRDMHYLALKQRWLNDYGLVGRDIFCHGYWEIFPEIGAR